MNVNKQSLVSPEPQHYDFSPPGSAAGASVHWPYPADHSELVGARLPTVFQSDREDPGPHSFTSQMGSSSTTSQARPAQRRRGPA